MENEPRTGEIVALSYEQLTELLDEYKRELGLEHWTIGLGIRRRIELGNRHGHVFLLEAKTQAFIRLLEAGDADPLELVPYDMEVALVHELCHCAFAPFVAVEEGSHEDIVQEQAINRFSISFVAVKRRERALRTRIAELEGLSLATAKRRAA